MKPAHKVKLASLAELELVVTQLPDRSRLMMALLAAWCAMRFGELAELRRGDLDLKTNRVKIRRSVVRVRAEMIVGPPKTDAGIRDVAIPPHLIPSVSSGCATTAQRSVPCLPIWRLRDHVVGRGMGAVTLDEVMGITGLSRGSATEAMRRARATGQFFTPVPGLYIPIPSEYSAWGVVPATDFIDQMMGFLGRSYYVGLLSAAELHGAAHQRPQVFQVMVDRRVADRDIERVRLRFYERTDVDRAPVTLRNSSTAQVRVSTPEATVLDLAARPRDSGSLNNVATIVGELAGDGKLDADELVAVAPQYPLAVVRRLGWLLDCVASYADTQDLVEPLHDFVTSHSDEGRRAIDVLAAGGPRRGSTNGKWGLVENTAVEPDL